MAPMSDGWTPPVEPPDGGGGYGTPPQGPPGTPWGAPPGTGAQPGWGAPPGGGQPGWGTPPGGGQPGWGAPPGGPPPQGGQPGWGPPPGAQPGSWGQGWGQQNSPWGAPPAAKPGLIPLRPLGVGEILDGAFTVIRHYPRVTLGLSAVVATVSALVQIGLFLPFLLGGTQDLDIDMFASFTTAALVGLLFSAVANAVLAGMLTSVMGEAVLGRPATAGETWARVRPRFWALLGAAFLGGLVPYLALVLCIVPGVFLWGAWALVTPALILERVSVRQALRRSWRLAVPDWWRVWGIRALAVLMAGFLGGIISIPGQMVAEYVSQDGAEVVAVLIVFLAQIVASTITTPFNAGVLSLIYIDRRMRAEGLDVTLAQAAAAQQVTEAGRF